MCMCTDDHTHACARQPADLDPLCVREPSRPEPWSWQQLLPACSAAVFAVAEKQVTACPLSAVFGNTLFSLRSCGMTKVWATGKTSWLTNLPLSVRVQGTLGSVQHVCCYVPVMLQVTVHVAKVGNIQVHSFSTRVPEVLRQCFEWWFNGFSHVKFSAFFQVQLSQKRFFFFFGLFPL